MSKSITGVTPASLPTFHQFEGLSDEDARLVAEGIIGIYATLDIRWRAGEWVEWSYNPDYQWVPMRACAMGAVRLAAPIKDGMDQTVNDQRNFVRLFGTDGLTEAQLDYLVSGVISANDGTLGLKRDEIIQPGGYPEEIAVGLADAYAFGRQIGSIVRNHFNPSAN